MTEIISLNVREALQTPGEAIALGVSLLNPELEAPPELNYEALHRFLPALRQIPSVYVELPNPISSPSTGRRLKTTLDEAERLGVVDQIALHTRLNREDVQLAVACGARRIHVYAGTKTFASGSMTEILRSIHDVTAYAVAHSVTFIRASLEHASQCDVSAIRTFAEGLGAINRSIDTPIIHGLGLPDTNGVATPEHYQDIVQNLQELLREQNLMLFLHLHDDGGRALETYESVVRLCESLEIPCCTEATPKVYPGERVGIRPTIEEIAERIPCFIPALLRGPSWIAKGQSPEDAKRTHVAGAHTKSMNAYSSGHRDVPHPGVYSIMGTTNIASIAGLLGHRSTERTLWKSTALLAREYASQFGHDKQERLLSLIALAIKDPTYILRTTATWGNPSRWVDSSSPDLEEVRALVG